MNLDDMVTVLCTDSTHEGERTIVTRFIKYEGQGWREAPGASARASKAHREMVEQEKPQTIREKLQLKQLADKPHAFQDRGFDGSRMRSRSNLRCELCGVTVPTRDEKLFPILDQLLGAGAQAITLGVLRATLGKH